MRATDYRRLDERGTRCTSTTPVPLSKRVAILQKHFELLRSGIFGIPTSANPTSVAMTEYVESTRRYVLSYFNAQADDYILVFTQNASAALKLVGESYPFAPGSRFLLTFDNHNSVNGIREFCAGPKNATVIYAPASDTGTEFRHGSAGRLAGPRLHRTHRQFYSLILRSPILSGVKHPRSRPSWQSADQRLGTYDARRGSLCAHKTLSTLTTCAARLCERLLLQDVRDAIRRASARCSSVARFSQN